MRPPGNTRLNAAAALYSGKLGWLSPLWEMAWYMFSPTLGVALQTPSSSDGNGTFLPSEALAIT